MLKQAVNPFMIAPMMGWTTRHYRYFFRLIAKKIILYTEMLPIGAILNNLNRDRLLAFNPVEQPLAIQLGGHSPIDLARAAKIVAAYGYTEINLNVGCPSKRVRTGCFGAILFKDWVRVAECVAAMAEAVSLPITIKTRIAVDDYESYDYLANFVDKVSQAGCRLFIIHARKAWLKGLSPKENREIPPLHYPWVYQIKQDFPHLTIVLNGGIKDLEEAKGHLSHVDGVMIGRAAWYNPYLFRGIDVSISDSDPKGRFLDRSIIVQRYVSYVEKAFIKGENLSYLLLPLLNIFHGTRGALHWRCRLTEAIQQKVAPDVLLKDALAKMSSLYKGDDEIDELFSI